MTSEVSIKQDIIRNKTAGDLYDFIQAIAWRGVISESLSSHLRAAIKKLFSATVAEGEFWRDVPLPIDISDRVAILRKRNAGECSERTIEAYHRRYDRSLRLYYEHLLQESVPVPTTPSPAPSNTDAQALAMQKVLAASLRFQQEVLSALSLLTNSEGGAPPTSA